MQPLKKCIGPSIRIAREILCFPYAGKGTDSATECANGTPQVFFVGKKKIFRIIFHKKNC